MPGKRVPGTSGDKIGMLHRGMNVSEPSAVMMIGPSLDKLYEVLDFANGSKLKYVLIAHPDGADEVHRK
jgi:hypothetical protein